MRINKKDEIILTKRQASELFCLLSNARLKLSGKLRTSMDRYWKEMEKLLGLEIWNLKNTMDAHTKNLDCLLYTSDAADE